MSQSIPNNWKDLSITFSKSTREFFIEKGVDVTVCADQTFIKYLLADDNLLVPTGVKRVGTTVQERDERKGVTLMLSAYVLSTANAENPKSGILPPFIVFNGKTGATLD